MGDATEEVHVGIGGGGRSPCPRLCLLRPLGRHLPYEVLEGISDPRRLAGFRQESLSDGQGR
jgi:hypothetical protein